MARVFVISDLHLGHLNIAIKRGFNSVEEYHKLLTSNWNFVVNKNDKVFILGDVTMESHKYYHLLSTLKGNKTFILGNHDKEQNANGIIKYGNVCGMLKYRGFWLTHCPIHQKELRDKKNIHGHTHEKHIKKLFGLIKDKRYINVCADVLNYTPILFTDIK